jgi:kexin
MVPRQLTTSVLALVAALLTACGGSTTSDPHELEQWYLNGTQGESHINLRRDDLTGQGVVVAVVDDGVERSHEDLVHATGRGHVTYLPLEIGFDEAPHGTAVAGIIAAARGNGLGGRGIAPAASIVSLNPVRAPAISNYADALARGLDVVDVSQNSWGDFNAWGEPFPLHPAISEALSVGTRLGRRGKGIVYVFAAGNGASFSPTSAQVVDNVNYSGLVNNRWTVPVCAVNDRGKRSWYSEKGATLAVCAPSSDHDRPGIFTTDSTGTQGYNTGDEADDVEAPSYTKKFGGTSAAAPQVSGVVALMLEVNPQLSWRDVKAILISTAERNDATHQDWRANGAGFWINHDYGYGLLHADRALAAAAAWDTLGSEVQIAGSVSPAMQVPDDDSQGIVSVIDIEDNITIEFVDVIVDLPDHPKLGDLEIVLQSPNGTRSVLAEPHSQLFSVFRLRNYRFGSLRAFGEQSRGRWQLIVRDLRPGAAGTLQQWGLVIHGHRGRVPAVNNQSPSTIKAQAGRGSSSGLLPVPY